MLQWTPEPVTPEPVAPQPVTQTIITASPVAQEASKTVSEDAFTTLIATYHRDYKNAFNGISAGGDLPPAEQTRCAILFTNGLDVSGWTGTVYKISSNGDGYGILEVTLSEDAWLETMNNSFSDSDVHTLITPNSPLYAVLGTLKEGDKVTFSGTFFSTSDEYPQTTDLGNGCKND